VGGVENSGSCQREKCGRYTVTTDSVYNIDGIPRVKRFFGRNGGNSFKGIFGCDINNVRSSKKKNYATPETLLNCWKESSIAYERTPFIWTRMLGTLGETCANTPYFVRDINNVVKVLGS
jgi:hypothetical protein